MRELTSDESSLLHPKGGDHLGAVEMEHYGKDFCPQSPEHLDVMENKSLCQQTLLEKE